MTDSQLDMPLPCRARCPLHWTAVAQAVGMPTETPAQPLTLSPVSGGEGKNLHSRPDGTGWPGAEGNLSPRPACGERVRVRGDRAAKLSRNYVTLNNLKRIGASAECAQQEPDWSLHAILAADFFVKVADSSAPGRRQGGSLRTSSRRGA